MTSLNDQAEYIKWTGLRMIRKFGNKKYDLFVEGTRSEVESVAKKLKGYNQHLITDTYTPKNSTPKKIYILYVRRDEKADQEFRKSLSGRLI